MTPEVLYVLICRGMASLTKSRSPLSRYQPLEESLDCTQPPIPLEELLRLYNVEKLPVSEIAARFNVTRQGIYDTVWRHKIKRRKPVWKPKPRKFRSSNEELYDLYWNQDLSLAQIGGRFRVSGDTIKKEMTRHGVSRRPMGGKYYPGRRNMLAHLKIGEKLLIDENPDRKLWLLHSIYRQAKKLGIRIRIRNLSERTFTVTRRELMSIEKIAEMHGSGMSIRKIAAVYSSSHERISKIVKQYRSNK